MGHSIALEAVNISAGGVLLKTKFYVAEENACLVFDFPLETKSIRIQANIVRKSVEGDCFLYGCKFLNKENDKAELRRFVFLKQIENRKIHDSGVPKSCVS
jgi:c-di-GMP-binding flagellar brake protein YcgR